MKLNKILLMLLLSIFVSTGVLASSEDIKITIDGDELYTDVAPKVINNRTMLPMRAIFEGMGAKVTWDNDTSTATGTRDNDTIKLQLGNPKASINGKDIILDVPAMAINQRTLVPVRFIAESLGSDVTWDGKNNTVVIKTIPTDEKYFEFDKEKSEITGYSKDGPTNFVIIPNTIDGVAVKSIGNDAFLNAKLNEVKILKGVTSIGDNAFRGNKLFEVIISKGVTSIGDNAFWGNKLFEVIISKGVTSIGDNAFSNNRLRSVIIPDGVTSIGDGAFSGNKLTSVTIPEEITSIGNKVFWGNQLGSVTIPKGVTSIGDSAFRYNRLTSVVIPDGVTNIGDSAFDDNVELIKNKFK